MIERIIQLVIVVIVIPAVLIGYLALVERLLNLLPPRWQGRARPLVWAGPALVFLAALLVYPLFNTIYLSLLNADSSRFVGLDNFGYAFSAQTMLTALQNNLLWLIFFTLFTVVIGLLMAVLTDRVSYEKVAKAIIFLPMAISFVAASVIWKFMFDYRPPGSTQTGTLNATLTAVVPDAQPQAWLVNPTTNNPALILVAVWMTAGFCMVILSAGLKGIPSELVEAARIDGASEWSIFLRITIPLLSPTITVVATTMIITSLKAFDIVYVLTNGNYKTDLIATQMYKELFTTRNFGHAAAIAVILLGATIPVMLLNLRSFRNQEKAR